MDGPERTVRTGDDRRTKGFYDNQAREYADRKEPHRVVQCIWVFTKNSKFKPCSRTPFQWRRYSGSASAAAWWPGCGRPPVGPWPPLDSRLPGCGTHRCSAGRTTLPTRAGYCISFLYFTLLAFSLFRVGFVRHVTSFSPILYHIIIHCTIADYCIHLYKVGLRAIFIIYRSPPVSEETHILPWIVYGFVCLCNALYRT